MRYSSAALAAAFAATNVLGHGVVTELFGLGGGGGAGAGKASAGVATPKGTNETAVLATTGMGAAQGLPTSSDDGSIKVVFHQVNQDGAGPLTADIDATSGGTEASAFQKAEISQNVPGLGIAGLSGAQTMDFPVEVKMPAGMTCQGQVAGASNVCIARLRNAAVTGPFGGSVAFTQSPAAKKRAIEYNLCKRMLSRRFAAAAAQEDEDDE
ncbi:MAS3 protein [Gaeumannomyces tritici R3-111a-1]|uniref:MAS3 protein n=1 Tax=Gaeumannomyces tritici (strain R3-111a-1) TaxID=644352 RepID=J3NN46_GAET3|nr:MAS3 protein [Gaeumannomyces tritici R3-111a-1]EJT77598.1 MAS3 protein [Gaeumannomyces tritici R3-111a-1]